MRVEMPLEATTFSLFSVVSDKQCSGCEERVWGNRNSNKEIKVNVTRLLENLKILKPMASVFVRFLKVKRHPKLMDKVICPGNYLAIVL